MAIVPDKECKIPTFIGSFVSALTSEGSPLIASRLVIAKNFRMDRLFIGKCSGIAGNRVY